MKSSDRRAPTVVHPPELNHCTVRPGETFVLGGNDHDDAQMNKSFSLFLLLGLFLRLLEEVEDEEDAGCFVEYVIAMLK